MVNVASNTPRNRAPASPIYIFAGLLFQTKKPRVAPAVTVERAAIKYWSPFNAKNARAMDEIATVPAAPPSRLSKKLIELQIPTTQITVMIESKTAEPVGLPTFLVAIKIPAVNMPATLCAINLGSGFRFLRSSHHPIKPSSNAGPSTEVASQKVLVVKFETKEVE